MSKAVLAVSVIIIVVIAIIIAAYYETSYSFSSGIVLPGNATVSSILSNGSTNYLILAQLIDRDFYNNTNTLRVNYSGKDTYSGNYSGVMSSVTYIYNYSYVKYYRNESFTARKLILNGSNSTRSNFVYISLNGSNSSYSSNYFCGGTNSSNVTYSCNSSLSAVPDVMYHLFEISTRPSINITSIGQRTYNGISCTLLMGIGGLPASQPQENVTFTTCISGVYDIPLNITETGASSNSSNNALNFSVKLYETSLSTNITDNSITKLLK
jgi:hypothetical protein